MITYTDVLGRLSADVDISVFGGIFSDRKYVLHTLIHDYPSKSWSIDTPIDEIVREMGNSGFVCTVKKDGYNNPVIHCVHAETQAAIDKKKNDMTAKFANAERGYIRFGDIPRGGRSMNYRDSTLEAGVSCFRAEFAANGKYRLLLTPVQEVSYLTVMSRDAYRLYGDEVGTGADGEPLLKVSKAVELN